MKAEISLADFLPQEVINKLKLQARLEGRSFRRVLKEFERKIWNDIKASNTRVKRGS